ncbi:MAG: hypothetical protein CMI16_12515 [Opitutaceae bacterium]|nr:hypothetical protein [Opitutaceae bacterium]
MRRVRVSESESESESEPDSRSTVDVDRDVDRDAYLRHIRFAEAVGGLATGMTGLVLAILFVF